MDSTSTPAVTPTLKRVDKWETALHDFFESRLKTPFAWGTNDCATFVCDGIQAITGTDIAVDFRGKYTTQLGAAKVTKQVTGKKTTEDIAEYVTAKFGMVERPSVKFAQRGDAVLFDGSEGTALGLVYLDGRHAIFVGEGGLKRIDVLKCRRAWKVGA